MAKKSPKESERKRKTSAGKVLHRDSATGSFISQSFSPQAALLIPPKPAQKPRIGNLGPMIARAIEVIGDREEALRWLGTPVRGLGYATPISLLGTKEGAQRVDDILGQIEHGIW